MASLKIGEVFLDLFKDESVPTDFVSSEIGKLTERQGIRSIAFKVPGTDKNHKTLGLLNKLSFQGTIGANKQIDAELRQNNTTLSFGFLQITSYDSTKNTYAMRFFGGNVGWFQLLKDKTLISMDLTRFNHVYDEDAVVDSGSNTDGYIYPFINYGQFTDRATNDVTFDEFFPAVYVHTVVKQMFEDIGFKITGTALQLPVWEQLILPFTNLGFFKSAQFIDLNSAAANQNDGSGVAANGQVFSAPGVLVTVENHNDSEFGSFDKGENYDTTTFRYTAPDIISLKVEITWKDIAVIAGTKRPEAVLLLNGITTLQTVNSTAEYTGNNQQTIRFNTELLQSGDFVEVQFRVLASPSIQFSNDGFSNCKFLIQQTLAPDSIVDISNSVPTIKQTDLLRTLFFQFGIVFTTDNFTKTVSLDLFSDVKKNIINAVDWSSKLDTGKTSVIDFVELIQDYAKVNEVRYARDEADIVLESYQSNFGRSYGDGVIDIDNDFLKDRTVLFESIFAPTRNIDSFSTSNMSLPFIPLFELPSDTTPNIDPIARILIVARDIRISDFSNRVDIAFAGQNVIEMPYAYFYKGSLSGVLAELDDQLAFDPPSGESLTGTPLLEKYYSDQRLILNEPRFIKAFFDINQIDITNLDFGIPIFIQQFEAYFYINIIKQYKANQDSTQVELIRLQ